MAYVRRGLEKRLARLPAVQAELQRVAVAVLDAAQALAQARRDSGTLAGSFKIRRGRVDRRVESDDPRILSKEYGRTDPKTGRHVEGLHVSLRMSISLENQVSNGPGRWRIPMRSGESGSSLRGNSPRSIVVAVMAMLVAGLPAACVSEPVAESWTRDGEKVSIDVIETYNGSGHCDWEKARFLQLAWPILPDPDRRPRSNQYVRDPEGVLGDGSLGRALSLDATLPDDAKPTGYSREGTELWLAESDREKVAYLVTGNPRLVEAWPRADPPFGCD